MQTSRSMLLVLGIWVPCQAVAQDEPFLDCGRPEGAAQELICEDADLARLDRRMAERFEGALAASGRMGERAEESTNSLRAYQRGWIKGRDECWKTDELRACVQGEYLRREGLLVALWGLEQPVARTTWICENNPANEVAVWFFDTELSAIRIEYGDEIDTGHLAQAASGARYAASFGREFWENGGEALFSWDDGEPMACRKVSG